MTNSDEENVTYATNQEEVDKLNSEFYGQFPFPWPAQALDKILDDNLEARMINQAIGLWDALEIPADGRIWVAGCGTNQAVITALKFPTATIIATDISTPSLRTAETNSRSLGLRNLVFMRQSINNATFHEEFDFIICTGVIHHNADPVPPLKKLRAALKPGGLCELMVYNRYHRVWTTAFQKVVQIMIGANLRRDFRRELDFTRRMLRANIDSSMGMFFEQQKDSPETAIADACLQPVEHSYTIESFQTLLQESQLELVAPCINYLSSRSGEVLWNMTFEDQDLMVRYSELPDVNRWQVTNLLLLERSPMLWFYVQRTDSGRRVKSERELCAEFLSRAFKPVDAKKRICVRRPDRGYELSARSVPYPGPHADRMCRQILVTLAEKPRSSMGSILETLGIGQEFTAVNRVRQLLTTCAFPHILSAPSSP